MVITDKGVENLSETFPFQFKYDLIEHDFIKLVCLDSLSD